MSFVLGGVSAAVGFWAQAVRGVWNGDPIKVGIMCIPGGLGSVGKSQFFLSLARESNKLTCVL